MDLKAFNNKLFKRARIITYCIAGALAVLAFLWNGFPDSFVILSFANSLGFLAFTFISLALMVTPVRVLFPAFPFIPTLIHARRAFGVSGFVFALLHSLTHSSIIYQGNILALFAAYAGFEDALLLAFAAFFILLALFLTSTDFAVAKLKKKWQSLHRLVYLAYPFIIWHAVRIGSDFASANAFSIAFFLIAALTLLLEAGRIVKHFARKSKQGKQEL